MNLNTEYILNNFDENSLPDDVRGIFDLLKKHKSRVRFVKETDGINNLLVLSTNETIELISPSEIAHFAIFLVRDKQQDKIKQVHYYEIDEIERNLELFLTKTTHNLFVQIFFKGNILNNDDQFKLYYLMDEQNCTINEAYSKIQKIPDFYNDYASTSTEIKMSIKTFHKMMCGELEFLNKEKESLIAEIEKEVLNKNEDWYSDKLSIYKRIAKQSKELEQELNYLTKI